MAHHDLTLEAREMDHLANASFGIDADDPLFYVCWRRQSCGWCLEGDAACSWCAVVNLLFIAYFSNRSVLPFMSSLDATVPPSFITTLQFTHIHPPCKPSH